MAASIITVFANLAPPLALGVPRGLVPSDGAIVFWSSDELVLVSSSAAYLRRAASGYEPSLNETAFSLGEAFVLRLPFEELAGLASRSAEGLTEELWTALAGCGLADCGGRCATQVFPMALPRLPFEVIDEECQQSHP